MVAGCPSDGDVARHTTHEGIIKERKMGRCYWAEAGRCVSWAFVGT
jgi:hypothetical protein